MRRRKYKKDNTRARNRVRTNKTVEDTTQYRDINDNSRYNGNNR